MAIFEQKDWHTWIFHGLVVFTSGQLPYWMLVQGSVQFALYLSGIGLGGGEMFYRLREFGPKGDFKKEGSKVDSVMDYLAPLIGAALSTTVLGWHTGAF